MKRNAEIRTRSFIRVDGESVPFSALTEEQKTIAATRIKLALMNELYRGEASFTARKTREDASPPRDDTVVPRKEG